ncbi:MAG TPA: hypothetical protein VF883_02925 [Thermoanaerobaculia bacterium]|jgi:hypothetical protein
MAKPKRRSHHTKHPKHTHNTPSKRQADPRQRRAVWARITALVRRIVAHYRRGEGFAHHNLLPNDHGGASDTYSPAYYDQARLLDLVTRIVRAAFPSPRHSRENPTITVLDYLIKLGAVTDITLIADVLSTNAHMLLIGADRYVTGLGWPRLCIVRTPDDLKPIFRSPAVRENATTPEYLLVPGIYEWIVVYYKAAPSEVGGRLPAYRIDLAAACALRNVLPSAMYSWTSGSRRDWQLDAARLRPRATTRELRFDARLFWYWLHNHQRD